MRSVLIAVRNATSQNEVGWGFLPVGADIEARVFVEAENYFRTKAPESGVGITIRCPGGRTP